MVGWNSRDRRSIATSHSLAVHPTSGGSPKDRRDFRRVAPTRKRELDELLRTIAGRVRRYLQRRGWLYWNAESSRLSFGREDTSRSPTASRWVPWGAEGLHVAEAAWCAAAEAIQQTIAQRFSAAS
jgi:hypothetical protein